MSSAAASWVGGTWSWVTTYDDAGNYGVSFECTDGELVDVESDTVTVTDVNGCTGQDSQVVIQEAGALGVETAESAEAACDGADLVIGHGPHVVRAAERYKDRLIAYSLGNFATYYGISVAGPKGYAPIVVANIDGEARDVSIDGNWKKLLEDHRGFHWMMAVGGYAEEMAYACPKIGIEWNNVSETV